MLTKVVSQVTLGRLHNFLKVPKRTTTYVNCAETFGNLCEDLELSKIPCKGGDMGKGIAIAKNHDPKN